ncbi:acyltransferase [Limibacterium fermenti]|uniref:acyltransferase n=1 Tax=Limibacterium fermenti TaxID=3229863 RepID=UPI003A6AD1AA
MTKAYKMDIAKSARISFGAKLDKTNPSGIHIGDESYVASGAIIFTHDFARSMHADTYIGKRCFIGANAIVMCGITIGDNVIVGSGSVVTKNIPSNCIAAGNPARVIKENIHTKKFGQLDDI